MVGAAVMADEEAFVAVRPGCLVHGRGALDRGVERQIADIVLVQPQLQLGFERQGVKPPRGGKGTLDHRFRHAVAGGIEKADLFAGAAGFGGGAREGAGLAGKIRCEIDDGDLCRRGGVILDPVLLKQVHRSLRRGSASIAGRGRARERVRIRPRRPGGTGAVFRGGRPRGRRCSRAARRGRHRRRWHGSARRRRWGSGLPPSCGGIRRFAVRTRRWTSGALSLRLCATIVLTPNWLTTRCAGFPKKSPPARLPAMVARRRNSTL